MKDEEWGKIKEKVGGRFNAQINSDVYKGDWLVYNQIRNQVCSKTFSQMYMQVVSPLWNKIDE